MKGCKRSEIEALVGVAGINDVEIIGTSDGLYIQIYTKGGEIWLVQNERFPHNVKQFKQIETAIKFLRALGISKIKLDLINSPQ